MRKKDREIKDEQELKEILQKADVCRIAFAVDETPYIVTMNFGYIMERPFNPLFPLRERREKTGTEEEEQYGLF